MRSEPPRQGRVGQLLRSQELGLACAGATILLLAAGSVILTATRDGASAGVRLDDLRIFFQRPSLWHLWLYLLIPVLLLYALNTLLCTWQSLVRLVCGRVREPGAYGPAVMHLGFIVALAAHAVGGVMGAEGEPVVVGPDWTDLGGEWRGRLLDLRVERLPGGMPKQVHARLEMKDPSGHTSEQKVGFNRPASAEWGARLWLLSRFNTATTAQLSDGQRSCTATKGETCQLGGVGFHVLGLAPGGRQDEVPAVRLLTVGAGGHEQLMARLDQPATYRGGSVTLTGLTQRPVMLLRDRRSPGNPVALVAVAIFVLGMLLMGRRWLS